MKSLNLLAILLLAAACSQPESKNATISTEPSAPAAATATPVATYAFAPRYSNDFSFDESNYAQIVMTLWKQFEENKLSEGSAYFADSVVLMFPDGSQIHNTRDSVMAMTNAYRNEYKSFRSEVDVVIPMKSNDKGERFVLVWGEEYFEKKGKKDSALLHEIWLFNKEGKISMMHQFTSKG